MTDPACRHCGAPMRPGIAMGQTYTGIGDFHDADEVSTLSAGCPGVVVPVSKCTACGWSVG